MPCVFDNYQGAIDSAMTKAMTAMPIRMMLRWLNLLRFMQAPVQCKAMLPTPAIAEALATPRKRRRAAVVRG